MAGGFSLPDLGLSVGAGARLVYANPALRVVPDDPVAAELAALEGAVAAAERAHGARDARALMAHYNLAKHHDLHRNRLSASQVAELNRTHGGPGAINGGLITSFAAEAPARTAFVGFLRTLGEGHERTLDAAYLMALCFFREGRYRDAEGLLADVARHRRAQHGLHAAPTLGALTMLGLAGAHGALRARSGGLSRGGRGCACGVRRG
jgi:hypothetical protein